MELESLKKSLESNDWFSGIEVDKFNRIVVYVNYLSRVILETVPDTHNGVHVLTHFASSKKATRDSFVEKLQFFKDPEPEPELSLELLSRELDRLSDVCGWETLGELFLEVHDGDNAVTNFSSVFKSVSNDLSRLYNLYGYDVMANELRIDSLT